MDKTRKIHKDLVDLRKRVVVIQEDCVDEFNRLINASWDVDDWFLKYQDAADELEEAANFLEHINAELVKPLQMAMNAERILRK